ncbi:sigma-54-dependent transcriptional regulator [Inmirania thermothiophila]|uniref:Two-component response regulator CbrB n=1 Tax=Inmirania thermothiophila TaxID=1750597 RepID=A0A3N1Y3G3_9GAMM|nr:sigma-54 dependent transcriptional regulator [Inmirania thermothiophila]ROR32102.1 two-component response regulator CbrB [Inmirania thermothiophila]
MGARILILEDEPVIRRALRRLLERHGHTVEEAATVAEAEAACARCGFDLVIADLRLPGAPGTDIIGRCGDAPVLVMTSYASIRSAVESMKKGAVDYIAKPFDHDEMVLTVERILRQHRLERENRALRSELARSYPVHGMVGECPAMQEVFRRIRKVAATDTTVLILGESGTGKELVARALHEQSPRADRPLITVNCAAIPETLIESELFGHERGAFTGAVERRQGLVEAADGGTLFLDEVGELPLTAQSRLLRLLQEGTIRRLGEARERQVDVRLVAATHRDLQRLVAEGAFREDLYFRLRVMEIWLPPLRERGDDIERLAAFLLEKVTRRLNRPPMHFTEEALAAMRAYHWPGNVRELENAIERAVILAEDERITPALLALGTPASDPASTAPQAPPADLSLEAYFRHFVLTHQEHMTETELARRLGISRKALWERRQRLGIPRPRRRQAR